MRTIDNFINSVTMYVLVAGGLFALALIAILFGATGNLPFDSIDMTISLVVAVGVTTIASYGWARLYGATTTLGSPVITGLILFFLFNPASDVDGWLILALAGVLAMASKYILAWHRRHMLNPAALSAVVLGWIGLEQATWWVAAESLAIFVAILGILILRKLHRFQMFFVFAVVALLTMLIIGAGDSRSAIEIVRDGVISFPLLFLGTVMLTEPMTMPVRRGSQMVYAALVGVFFVSNWHVGEIYMTPELALIIGNVLVFVIAMQRTFTFTLTQKREIGPSLMEYQFASDAPVRFTPGQYIDVSLPHVELDSRGNRRSFSFASTPSEDVLFGVKHNDPSSKYKKRLLKMKPGDVMFGHNISGTFTAPDQSKKYLFVAGGIGITPFRSILNAYVEAKQPCNVVLFYQVNEKDEIVYRDVLSAARKLGMRFVPVLSTESAPEGWKGETGFIDAEMLERRVKDVAERDVYISGPPNMVASYKKLFRSVGVPRRRIHTDYFSGY